jgi:hydrogenase maturation protein HypF
VTTCRNLRKNSGISKVVLSGGVFMNALLASIVQTKLLVAEFCPFQHSLVPPNDGGLSLGQLAIAARQIGGRSCA